MSYGLALSGGGFRATLFHLGVVRYLRSEGLLRDVKAVCAVSGGSILAAHLVLNWRDYNGDDQQFQKMVDQIYGFISFGLRNRILRRLPFLELGRLLLKPIPQLRYNETDLLAYYYGSRLYAGATLRDLASARSREFAPELFLLTTNLTRHDGLCFFSDEGFFVDEADKATKAYSQATPVAQAVAASSAYPGLFRPLEVTSRSLRLGNQEFNPIRQDLTDGGIYDNLGLIKLRQLRKRRKDLGLQHLILSNAGAKVDWEPEVRYSTSRTRTLLRCADIWQYRINEDLKLLPAELLVSIHTEVGDAIVGNPPSNDAQRQIGRIRTDLDAFSRFEFWCLYNHGYSVAKMVLSQLGKHAAANRARLASEKAASNQGDSAAQAAASARAEAPELPYQPWNRLGVIPDTDFVSTLETSRRRRLNLFDPQDWVTWVYPAVALIGLWGIYQGTPLLASRVIGAVQWLSQRATEPYPAIDNRLPTLSPTQVGQMGFLTDRPGAETAKNSILRMSQGLYSAKVNDQILLAIEQDGDFKGSYRTLNPNMKFESNAKATDGKAFMIESRKGGIGSGYREISMPRDERGSIIGTINLVDPTAGEYLLLLLVVEPKSRSDSGSKFPSSSVGEYKFSLEVE